MISIFKESFVSKDKAPIKKRVWWHGFRLLEKSGILKVIREVILLIGNESTLILIKFLYFLFDC
jgi:hypothetical protein